MRINFWYLSSIIVSLTVLIPILTVFSSFFQDTSNYFEILKETFFLEYIFNSIKIIKTIYTDYKNMTSFLKGNPYLCDKQYKSIPNTILSFHH